MQTLPPCAACVNGQSKVKSPDVQDLSEKRMFLGFFSFFSRNISTNRVVQIQFFYINDTFFNHCHKGRFGGERDITRRREKGKEERPREGGKRVGAKCLPLLGGFQQHLALFIT